MILLIHESVTLPVRDKMLARRRSSMTETHTSILFEVADSREHFNKQAYREVPRRDTCAIDLRLSLRIVAGFTFPRLESSDDAYYSNLILPRYFEVKRLIRYGLLASTFISSAAMAQTQTLGMSGTTGMIVLTPLSNNTMPTGNQIDNSLSIGVTGGAAGSVHSAAHNLITLYGAPSANFWTVLDGLTFSGSGGTGQHSAHYDQTLRYGTGPQLWAAVAEMTDFTNNPSSQTGANLAYEMDLTGHQLDDAEGRQVVSGVMRPASDSTTFFEATTGYNLSINAGAYARHFYSGGGAYTSSAIELRYGASFNLGATSLSGVTFPVTTAAVNNSATIPVSNVMPFTSDTWGRELNSNQSTNTVYINGLAYTEVGYAVTGAGPTPAGTLTLSGAVTLPISGLQVANTSAAIWLATGQPINLDTNGATGITSNGSTVTVKGTLAAAMAGGANCAVGKVTLSKLTVVNGVITGC